MLISIKGFNIINETDLRNQIIKRCDEHQDDAEWNKVLTLVKTEPFAPLLVVQKYLEICGSEEELFGNVIPMMRKINLLWHKRDFDKEQGNRPVKPLKTSVYKDKGSRRPDHVTPKYLRKHDRVEVDNHIELPLRSNSANFWSDLGEMREDFTRTIRESKLLMEEEEKKFSYEISKKRKQIRSKIKASISILKEIEGESEFIQNSYTKLAEINRVVRSDLYIFKMNDLMTEIQEEISSREDSLSCSRSQRLHSYYIQFQTVISRF